MDRVRNRELPEQSCVRIPIDEIMKESDMRCFVSLE